LKIEREIEIAASPRAVYDFVMDPRRLGDWVTIHAELKEAPDGELEKGSELTQCLKLAGRKFNVHWKVVRDERPSCVVWEGKGPVRTLAKVVYEFRPNEGGTCFAYTNEYKMPGGPLGRVAGRAFERTATREADRSLERLKKRLEG